MYDISSSHVATADTSRAMTRADAAEVVVRTVMEEAAGVAVCAVMKHARQTRGDERKMVGVGDHPCNHLVIQARVSKMPSERAFEVRVGVEV